MIIPGSVALGVAAVGGALLRLLDGPAELAWAIVPLALLAGGTVLVRVYIAPQAAANAPPPITAESVSAGEGLLVGLAPHGGGHPAHVVALGGHSKSGKSELARGFVAEYSDWELVSCGDFVLETARARGIDPNDLTETNALGQRLVSELGPQGFLDAVLQGRDISAAAGLIIDDIYHQPVLDAVRARFSALTFVGVELPSAMRVSLEAQAAAGAAEVEDDELNTAVEELLENESPPMVQGVSDASEIAQRSGELYRLVAHAA